MKLKVSKLFVEHLQQIFKQNIKLIKCKGFDEKFNPKMIIKLQSNLWEP
jgi:hypothetical protein